MPRLTFRSGPRQGTSFDFDHSLVVGRGKNVDLQLDDASVSRRHASIVLEQGVWRLVDLGSANGTDLNGRPVSAATALADGDTIAFGGVVAVFTTTAAAAAASAPVRNVKLVESHRGEVVLSIPAELQHGLVQDTHHVRRALQARLDFLDSLSKLTDLIFDEPRLLEFVLDHVLDSLPQADRSCVVAFDPATTHVQPLASRTRGGKSAEIAVSRTLLADVVARREAVLIVEGPSADRWRTAESFVLHRIRSAICVPLIFNGEIHGVLQVDNGTSPMPFEQADLDLLRAVAHQVAMTLAYARLHASAVEQKLIEHDLQLARRVQQQFLPERPPTLPGFAFTVDYVPALGVSGDFYDFLTFTPERTGIVIGDVSGKGVPAALYGAFAGELVRSRTFRRRYTRERTSPADVLASINTILHQRQLEAYFCTLCYMAFDMKRRVVTIANSGLPYPLRVSGGQCEVVELPGIPLGTFDGTVYDERTFPLHEGDTFVACSDGVLEAASEDGEEFGRGRLMEVLRGVVTRPAAAIVDAIYDAVERHAGGVQGDDITAVAVKITA